MAGELPYIIILEGYDDAFLGFVVQEKLSRPTVAVYSRKLCVEVIMNERKYDREKAIEYFEEKVENLWQGDDAPLILNHCSVKEYYQIFEAMTRKD